MSNPFSCFTSPFFPFPFSPPFWSLHFLTQTTSYPCLLPVCPCAPPLLLPFLSPFLVLGPSPFHPLPSLCPPFLFLPFLNHVQPNIQFPLSLCSPFRHPFQPLSPLLMEFLWCCYRCKERKTRCQLFIYSLIIITYSFYSCISKRRYSIAGTWL